MEQIEKKRKKVAICYDFDKTLSPDNMQAQGYIQSLGFDEKRFWQKADTLAYDNDMDSNLAYMYVMVTEAEGKIICNRKSLFSYGESVSFYNGVETWFERINDFGAKLGVDVEHYVISSGIKEMIEGTRIAKMGVFKKIYASSFYYNKRGVAKWPAQMVNYTNKTQFLFRISKGVLDVNDDSVNDYFPTESIRVPFTNFIYIGDSETDVPCMKLVLASGGTSIGVFDGDKKNTNKVEKLLREKRISCYAPADYSDGSELDGIIKNAIEKVAKSN